MSVRSEIADHIKAGVPSTWTVYDHGRNLDGIPTVTVMVEQTSVKPGASAGLRTVAVTVYVAVGKQDPPKAEDALEDALAILLDAMDDLPHISLSADRSILQDTFPAYSVTVEVPTRKDI